MPKISRSVFLKKSSLLASSFFLAQFPFKLANAATADVSSLMKRMIVANDELVKELLADRKKLSGRGLGQSLASVAAAYVSQGSSFYHDPTLIKTMDTMMNVLFDSQSADGTLNFGNLESPPDTGFLLESVTAAAHILRNHGTAPLQSLNDRIKTFIQKAAHGLIIGGVHTPNHRWVVCAALSKVHKLYPDPMIIARIEDWLDEGIFNDADGHYPERSQNYAVVENNSLITLSRMLDKKELLTSVRKNLTMTYYYMEPNGELVVNDSRRQDQWTGISSTYFYLHYRFMAIHDKNGTYAGITQLMETFPEFEKQVIKQALYLFLDEPILQQELPAVKPLDVNFEKLFTTSSLLRIRRNETTATLFGGADLPILIASGRSCSPNLFAYRKGDAILKYLRLSTNFFSTGYFYSDGLKKVGKSYVLHNKMNVPYYQPLPKHLRKKDGDYTLSPSIDDRFWNKMDFKNRPVSNVKTLDTTITLTEQHGAAELLFDIKGPAGVLVTIELCFKEGGKLTGVQQGMANNMFLESGSGTYSFGKDSLSFGPGMNEHKMLAQLEGERYATHFGSLRTEGMHVYITGKTPFKHTLTFN